MDFFNVMCTSGYNGKAEEKIEEQFIQEIKTQSKKQIDLKRQIKYR